jgi:hypothetical protein
MAGVVAVRTSDSAVNITVRRSSDRRRYRFWVEVDGDFGVALAQSRTLAGLQRNAARAIRHEWTMRSPREKGVRPPEIAWHRSSRRYARGAGRDVAEIRRRLRASDRTARRLERGLRRAGAYAREARYIARGQVYVELDREGSRRAGRLRSRLRTREGPAAGDLNFRAVHPPDTLRRFLVEKSSASTIRSVGI